MGTRIGVASLMTLLFFLVGFSFASYTTTKEYYISKNCFDVLSSMGLKAELLNVYFLRIGAASFFEYVKYNRTVFICYNANLDEVTKLELRNILKRMR